MKLSSYAITNVTQFAKRAETIFERYGFKWGGRAFNDPDYIPSREEILNQTYHLIDCAVEYLKEHPDLHSARVATGRLVVTVFRPAPNATELTDVCLSLDII